MRADVRTGPCRVVFGVVVASLLAACAHQPQQPVPPEALHPRSIAIIPVLRTADLTINRQSFVPLLGGIALVIERVDRYQKQQVFESRLEPNRAAVARALTDAMEAAARRRGFNVVVLENVKRDAADPDEFDYRRIDSDADVIVHVRVGDLGLYNPRLSTDYEPYIDASVTFVARSSGFEMLDENFYYGTNGSPKDPYSVASDPNDRWPDFEAVMSQSDSVEKSWLKGAQALGERIISKLPAPAAH